VRLGLGLLPLDRASVTSLGLGYRLSPSTSLKLRYGLVDYTNQQNAELTHERDRLTETSVSIEF
jgi:hypothetical protein